jgi:hypothetical protein
MYAVIHRYEIEAGSIESVVGSVSANFADDIPPEIGALLYTAADTGDGTVTTVLLFPDKATAEHGAAAAAAVQARLNAEFGITELERIEGQVLINRASGGVVERIDP